MGPRNHVLDGVYIPHAWEWRTLRWGSGGTLSAVNCAIGSTIDYFLVSDSTCVSSYNVLDPDCNLSDHRPIVVCCKLGSVYGDSAAVSYSNNDQTSMSVSQLRWDYGDIALYRELTGPQLQSILDGLHSR